MQLVCRYVRKPPCAHPKLTIQLETVLSCREKELAAVKVSKEDIDLVSFEFELDAKTAERHLRECNGVLIDTLKALL